jgi:hypothetical protein
MTASRNRLQMLMMQAHTGRQTDVILCCVSRARPVNRVQCLLNPVGYWPVSHAVLVNGLLFHGTIVRTQPTITYRLRAQ